MIRGLASMGISVATYTHELRSVMLRLLPRNSLLRTILTRYLPVEQFDGMRFNNPYWSNKLRINSLQRWIIVHSILYYELDFTLISDKIFDANAKQLVELQNTFPKDATKSKYWYVFNDFDGSTGFHLYNRLKKRDKEYLMQIAQYLTQQFK